MPEKTKFFKNFLIFHYYFHTIFNNNFQYLKFYELYKQAFFFKNKLKLSPSFIIS